jgi:hypothetical protein
MGFIRTNYRYNGEGTLPNPGWDVNFTGATAGSSYEVLYEDTASVLMASNTPASVAGYANAVSKITGGANVLIIGYGIGYFNEMIAGAGATLTIMEKYSAIMDLERATPEATVIIADPYTYNYTLFGATKFDLIIWDFTDPLANMPSVPFTDLETILATDGSILCWSTSGLKDQRSKESRAATAVIESLNNQGYFRSYSKFAAAIYSSVKSKLKEKRNIFFSE